MKTIKILFFCICFAAIIPSCTDGFEELNTRPDVLTADAVDASLIGQAFAQSQWTAMHGLHWRFQISQSLFSDLYSQYFATTAANFDSDRYTEVGRWIDLAWSSFYGQAAPQIKFVEDLSASEGLAIENAIAKIWKVQAYHRQTDYWGPIIYSQYGNGETSVAYDSQESIYQDFFATLGDAISTLESNRGATSTFGTNDQIYSGNVDQWLKYANTLRLRLALRASYADPGTAKAEAEKSVASGVMESNADNAFVATTANSMNPYSTITNWGEFRMSATMESILKGYNDPRMEVYFNPAASGDTDGDGIPYEGLRNGQPKVDKVPALNSDNSDMNTRWLPSGPNPPIKVITAAEAYFLRAEGALNGWSMGGSAKELYEMGIATSMGELAGADASAYVASSATPAAPDADSGPVADIPIAFDEGGGAERQLEQIITQKWIALYPDGWEAYAEKRRTGYPKTYPIIATDNPEVGIDQVMRRMTFVDSEFSNNQVAVEAAKGLLSGSDSNATKLWWDKK